MQADFDGDEVQFYFMAGPGNITEIANLLSMYTQMTTYESGKNIIGGAPDVDCGIYYIKLYKKFIKPL